MVSSLTNSTYDGLCYNAELIKDELEDAVEVLHFDETWYGYAAFHEFYAGRSWPPCPRIILAENSIEQQLDVERFNEVFMMHTSTSPHQRGYASALPIGHPGSHARGTLS